MWSYVLQMLRRQRGKNALASGGFLVAACALVLLSATTQTTTVVANQIISQSWRPTYDLVVLPTNVKLPPGQVVPSDYLEGYGGGISMQQYQTIKTLAGVEVAAPIAYISYMSLPSPAIAFPDQTFATGFYQLNWRLSAFNGQKQLVEYQESLVYYVVKFCFGAYSASPLAYVLQHPEVMNNDNGTAINGVPIDCSSGKHAQPPTLAFATPDTGGFLLAAVDPAAEDQLVRLNQSVTTGRMLTEQDTIHTDNRFSSVASRSGSLPYEAIPMLIHQNLPGQLGLSTQFTRLALGNLPTDQLPKLNDPTYVAQLPDKQTIMNGPVPLVQNDPARFANTDLLWNGHTWQTGTIADPNDVQGFLNGYIVNLDAPTTPAPLTYQPTTAPDGSAGYSLVPTGTQGPEVAFRPLTPLQTLKKQRVDVVYTYEEDGQFSDASIASQFANPLNWLPENTYTTPPVTLRYDAAGHPITPTTLLPTTNKAGYILQPPLALTTLDAGRQLVGDNLISAIRVRVAGVNQADLDSWQKIQQIAGLIHQRTGLTVVITLGSSPQPVLVYVPGARENQFGQNPAIAPTGWVEERWISIGVSIIYLEQLGVTRLLVLFAVLLVCFSYLVVTFNALAAAERRNLAILSALGWPPWQAVRLFLMRALLFALLGGIAGLAMALLIIALLRAVPIWLIVIWTVPAMLVLALLSSLYPLWQLWHIQPANILRNGMSVVAARGLRLRLPFWTWVFPIWALVLRNLARSRLRTLLTVGSLFFSAMLLVVMASGVLVLHQTLIGTLLGNFVLFQTTVPQIAGCVFAALLTFLSVADLLLLQVRERQREIGVLQAVGWHPRLVQRLFAREGVLLALIGTVPGALAGSWFLAAQHNLPNTGIAALIGLLTVVLLTLEAGLATLPAMRAVNRLQVVEVLRAE